MAIETFPKFCGLASGTPSENLPPILIQQPTTYLHFFPDICIVNTETGRKAVAYLISMGQITVSTIQDFPPILKSSDLLDKVLRLSVGSTDWTYVACGNHQIDAENLDWPFTTNIRLLTKLPQLREVSLTLHSSNAHLCAKETRICTRMSGTATTFPDLSARSSRLWTLSLFLVQEVADPVPGWRRE